MTQQVEITVKVTVEASAQHDNEKLMELAQKAIMVSAVDWRGLEYINHEIISVNYPDLADLIDNQS